MKTTQHPSVSITEDALVIRIPWTAVNLRHTKALRQRRRLTARNVLEMVKAGRLAHRLGKSRIVRSLEELTA